MNSKTIHTLGSVIIWIAYSPYTEAELIIMYTIHETKKGFKLDYLFANILSLWKVIEGYGPAMVFHITPDWSHAV